MEFAFLGTYSAAGWNKWSGTGFQVDDQGAVALAKEPFPTYVSPDLAVKGPAAVDIDVDPCGVLYVLSAEGSLHRYDRQQGRLERVPCLGGGNVRSGDATALCVTQDTIYVGYADDERSQSVIEFGDDRSDTEQDRDQAEANRPGLEGSTAASPSGRVHALSTHLLQTRWIIDEASIEKRRRPLGRPLAIVEGEEAIYLLERKIDDDTGYISRLGAAGGATTVIRGLVAPMDAAIDNEGNLYVLTNDDDPVIWRFTTADLREITEPITPRDEDRWIASVEPDRPICIETAEKDELLIGVGPETGDERVLYRYRRVTDTSTGDVSFALDREAALKRSCRRLQLTRGRTDGSASGLYAIDADEGNIYFLEEEYYYQRNERTGRYDARIITQYDTGDPRTQWHRARIELDIRDPNTRVRLTYRATDEPEPLGAVTEIAGIGQVYADRLREAGVDGISELIRRQSDAIASITDAPPSMVRDWFTQSWDRFDAWFASDDKHGSARSDPRDVLFENATGQYLWVTLELIGTESTSPRVDSLRAYFPRQSYLRYLPPIYQDDVESAAFLERFLSIFESEFVDLEEEIEGISRFLDARGVPSPYLSWLARWLAVETDETWSDEARRELLSQAPHLYRKRGTREGLLGILGIYLGREEFYAHTPDVSSEIEESTTNDEFPVSFNGGDAVRTRPAQPTALSDMVECTADELTRHMEDDGSERSGDGAAEQVGMYFLEYSDLDCIDVDDVRDDYRRLLSCPHCFLVLVGPAVDRQQMRAIQRIVDAERPVHTIGRAVGLRSSLRLGEHSYLGINTTLSDRTFLLEHSGLGNDAVLGEREPYAQIGLQSRIDEDNVLS
ncbi:phage tail protein [Halalkalicoccus salilacus]|uniref:phage tail protein n=1 Tax=Halalkalicoccus salilacus TaxID=3117459 RepID=UPI00300F1637